MDFSVSLEIATVIGAVVAGYGVYHTLEQWKKKQEGIRATFLEKLLSDFEQNELYCQLRLSDDAECLKIDFNRDNDLNLIYQFLQKCNHLCYLKNQAIITTREFEHFTPILERFIDNKLLRSAIEVEKIKIEPYKDFVHYAQPLYDEQKERIRQEKEIEESPQVVVTEGVELSPNVFEAPTMLIKINRLYREGMSDDEIYDVTRQWWKIRLERAEKMRYALAVSDSIVRKVFAIERWETDADAGEDYGGRIRFIGRVADDLMQKRFVGKSVKSLFPKGVANPIRYFEGTGE